MNNDIYFTTKNGKLINNHDIAKAAIINGDCVDAFDLDAIRKYAGTCKGIIKEINPSIKACLQNGEKVTAIKLYYLRHPGIKLQDAKKAVEDMEAKMKGFNTTKSYWCIVTNSDDTEMYLGWQKPVWDESGYFWTSKETIKKIVDTNNTLEHPFIFSSREEAIKHLKSMHLPQKCRVVK